MEVRRTFNKNIFNNSIKAIHCVKVPDVQWFRDEFANNIVELLAHAFLKASGNEKATTLDTWQRFFSHKSALI